MTSASRTSRRIIIIYNADGTIPGKLRYAYKKLFASGAKDEGKSKQPICGNCEITHGGLSLTETSAWTSSKASLESTLNVKVAQLHRDELDDRLKQYVKQNTIRLPTVLLDEGNSIKEIVPRDQINVCVLGKQDGSNSIEEQRATLLVESIKSAMQTKSKFDQVVKGQLVREDATSLCPFAINTKDQLSNESLLSHHSMFSSSLVVKAFASIASALLLQLFHIHLDSQETLASRLHSLQGGRFDTLLESIIIETERLSPPIIGVMRQVTAPAGIDLTTSGTHVPCGWDIWPYFPLINRDEAVFGSEANLFQADRYLEKKTTPLPLSFGAGVKYCAGQQIVRLWLRQLALAFLGRSKGSSSTFQLQIDTQSIDKGVLRWLGWLPLDESTSWRGVKQLPTQRPRKAIPVILKQVPRPAG